MGYDNCANHHKDSSQAYRRGMEYEFASASADKSIIIWHSSALKEKRTEWPLRAQIAATLKGHTESVTAISSLVDSEKTVWLASISADATARIWIRQQNHTNPSIQSWVIHQVLDLSPKMSLALAFTFFPDTNMILLAFGTVNNEIILFSVFDKEQYVIKDANVSRSTPKWFKKIATLTGHENWIRSLAFVKIVGEGNNGNFLMLASASQDRRVRIWKLEREAISKNELTKAQESQWLSTGYQHTTKHKDMAIVAQTKISVNLFDNVDFSEDSNDNNKPSLDYHPINDPEESPIDFSKINRIDHSSRLEGQEHEILIEQHGKRITLADHSAWTIKLDSVIFGHNHWVYSVSWFPPTLQPSKTSPGFNHAISSLQLLTCSMEKTIIIWVPDPISSVWIESAKVGQVSETEFGFVSGAISPDGDHILALDHHGAYYSWRKKLVSKTISSDFVSDEDDTNSITNTQSEAWLQQVCISGHYGEVVDACWHPSYSCFLSFSKDQTTRLWSRWLKNGIEIMDSNMALSGKSKWKPNWHEMSRPQVHGFDLVSGIFIPGTVNTIRFISCSEEKVLRVFEMPRCVYQTLNSLSDVSKPPEVIWKSLFMSATVPPLGLSNKPIYETNSNILECDHVQALGKKHRSHYNRSESDVSLSDQGVGSPLQVSAPPLEDDLMGSTLWPEIAKIYGHGNEICAITCSAKGDKIASACTCTIQTQEQAGIRIWETQKWRQIQLLQGPTLTITQLAFSHQDKYLIAVSRDRGIYLFSDTGDGEEAREDNTNPPSIQEDGPFNLIWSNQKAHQRIIWSVSWTLDDYLIATGSRDKSIIFWTVHEETKSLQKAHSLKLAHAITAVSWMPYIDKKSGYILAIGLETGQISLWGTGNQAILQKNDNENQKEIQMVKVLDVLEQDAHCDEIHRLTWRQKDDQHFELLSSSKDHAIRIFTISLNHDTTEFDR